MSTALLDGPPVTLPEKFQQVRADYNAANYSRFRRVRLGNLPTGSHADWHYRYEIPYLQTIEFARDLARNDTVVSAIVERSVQNIIGNGFSVDPQTGDDKLDRDLRDRFTTWAEDPSAVDLAAQFALHELAQQAMRAMFVDGGQCYILHDNGHVVPREAHRLRTPGGPGRPATTKNVVHGIYLDDNRRPLEYWFTREDISPLMHVANVGDMDRVPAWMSDGSPMVLHVYDPRRVTQTRGMTAFAPVIDALGMFEDINFANLVKAQVSACFVFLHERLPDWQGGATPAAGTRTTETQAGTARIVENLAPGMNLRAAPGEKITAFSPNIPNVEWFEHARFTLQLICCCVDLPLVAFLLDGRETNFSGWRGAIDQAKFGWRYKQKLMARHFYRPIYAWKLRQFLRDDAILRASAKGLGAAFFRHVWHTPVWPYIQPLQDAQAIELQRKTLQKSPTQLASDQGSDWHDHIEAIIADNAFALVELFKAKSAAEADILTATGNKVDIDPTQFLHLSAERPVIVGQAAFPKKAPTEQEPAEEETATPNRKPKQGKIAAPVDSSE